MSSTSTTLTEAKEAMLARFVSAWANVTPAQLDNEDYKPKEGVAWARVSVRHNGSGQETLNQPGLRRFSRRGSVFVQVFTPGNKGTSQTDALLTRAREAFEGVTLAGTTVRFLDVIAREVGPEDKWFMALVEAEFEYTETR